MRSDDEQNYQAAQCIVASDLYANSMSPSSSAMTWAAATRAARFSVGRLLRQSRYLLAVDDALHADGGHTQVLRQMLAPPLSQDQFVVPCPLYRKSAENTRRPLTETESRAVADTFLAWRDRRLTRWLNDDRRPTPAEIRRLIYAVSPLLAGQIHLTSRRTQSATVQEEAVVDLLLSKHWEKLPSQMVDRRATLGAKQFMKKTRFATKSRPQEVDIACGLGDTNVLAMECKVSNDVTNSVKRINDVLKKATAWREHWGSFVQPAALLQGRIAFRDVERLMQADVRVFWSHDLPRFERWIDSQISP